MTYLSMTSLTWSIVLVLQVAQKRCYEDLHCLASHRGLTGIDA